MQNPVLVIDTETGGLSPEIHSIFTLGFVALQDGKITNEGEVLIREPSLFYESEAMQVHGISLERVKEAGLAVSGRFKRGHL
jgi:DNA polymerase III epsilon subunit-like protein